MKSFARDCHFKVCPEEDRSRDPEMRTLNFCHCIRDQKAERFAREAKLERVFIV
jgi:hypothetical protein